MNKNDLKATADTGLRYTFSLVRRTGKNSSLKKGNQILNSNDRMHYIVKGDISRFLRELAHDTVKENEPTFDVENPLFDEDKPCQVLITIYRPSRRKIDPPNLYPTIKAILDGFTDAGVWSDDNEDIIDFIAFTNGGLNDEKCYKIEIDITPVDREDTL